jgi:glutamate formiminotransferase
VVDVVPFVPYEPGAAPPRDLTGALALRDEFARWLGEEVGIPTYLYGPAPGRTLPEVRRLIRKPSPAGLAPDFGPSRADPRAGISAVGARTVLVAYNVWVSSLSVAQRVAPLVRSANVRALGLGVGGRAQVSCNLVEPMRQGPAQVFDAVSALVLDAGEAVEGAEVVGLIPEIVLAAVPPARWRELGLSADTTVEARLREV